MSDKKPKPRETDAVQWWKEALFGLSPRALRERQKDIEKMLDDQVNSSGSRRRSN